ncbi:MDR family MFS transporter [Amycolatopsis vastitatis]|nr:MDR family MFS transporter [Amycolatopsis vastitatis]
MSAETNQSARPAASPPDDMSFSPALKRVMVVTTLGTFMAFLDTTIVNLALHPLSVSMHASLDTIQWLVTAYLLALAAFLPATSWLAGRFGAKNMYVVSIALFTLASLACGLADSAAQLIAFRVVQGATAGIAVPVAQMLLVRTSGPKLMARAMSMTGVPTILAPVIGPTIGGLLLEHAGWEWIFYLNVPIGVLTVVLSLRLLPRDTREDTGRLDVTGLLLIIAGGVALTYGLAEIGRQGRVSSSAPLIWCVVGLVLVTSFTVYALRARKPLVDLRLFKLPVYAAGALTSFCLGAAVFGASILLPLYFQIVRHEGAVVTGLLLIAQGIGVAIAIWRSARLIDKLGSGLTALIGGTISIVATIPFAFIGAHTPYWYLCLLMFVRGLGVGGTTVPATTAIYRAIPPAKIGDATVQLNVLQRFGGSLATAVFIVVLQSQLTGAADPVRQAAGFGTAFWWVVAIAVGCTLPTFLLVSAERKAARAPAAAPAA